MPYEKPSKINGSRVFGTDKTVISIDTLKHTDYVVYAGNVYAINGINYISQYNVWKKASCLTSEGGEKNMAKKRPHIISDPARSSRYLRRHAAGPDWIPKKASAQKNTATFPDRKNM